MASYTILKPAAGPHSEADPGASYRDLPQCGAAADSDAPVRRVAFGGRVDQGRSELQDVHEPPEARHSRIQVAHTGKDQPHPYDARIEPHHRARTGSLVEQPQSYTADRIDSHSGRAS